MRKVFLDITRNKIDNTYTISKCYDNSLGNYIVGTYSSIEIAKQYLEQLVRHEHGIGNETLINWIMVDTSQAIPEKPNNAGSMLSEAAKIVEGDRQSTHGDKERSFDAIAAMWTAYLATRENPDSTRIWSHDVAHMMVLLKMVRSQQGKPTRDHYVDMAGYAGLAGELALKK